MKIALFCMFLRNIHKILVVSIMKKVLFISSTGGHLRELMKLEPLFKMYDYSIITEKDLTTKKLSKKYKIYYVPYSTRSKLIRYFLKYSIVILKSIVLFIKIKPDAIVSTGTHTAIPICFLGKIFKKKIVYIETYANITRKSLTGKIIYPISDLFIVQWKEMKKLYPKSIYIDNGRKK